MLHESPQSGGILKPSDLRNPSLASYLRTLAGEYQSMPCCLCVSPCFQIKLLRKCLDFYLEGSRSATDSTDSLW